MLATAGIYGRRAPELYKRTQTDKKEPNPARVIPVSPWDNHTRNELYENTDTASPWPYPTYRPQTADKQTYHKAPKS